jgi:FKBP-type peptidyl-prolyl cis-trans isomerase FklB
MNWKAMAVLGVGLALALGMAQGEEKSPLATKEDKVSYSIGLSVGRNLKNQGIEVVPESMVLGIRDAMKDGKTLLTDDEIRQVMFAFQMEMRARQMDARMKKGEQNRKEGEDFLSENKKKKGVKTTESGLQYQVLKAGAGMMPQASDTVSAHYRGTLIDGTEFDSSYARGEPASFPVNQVIPGWSEVLQLMKVGAKWKVWIPSQLAYGERGAGQEIGPHAMLIFEIELIEIR